MEGGHESDSQEKYWRFSQHFRLLKETKIVFLNAFLTFYSPGFIWKEDFKKPVISLSLICQAQGKDREDFKNCSFAPSIILVSIPYPDKR